MAIRTISQIRSALMSCFKEIGMRRNERFWSDEDQYNCFVEAMGREPNASEMFPPVELGGQCQSGELGTAACDLMIELIRKNTSEHAAQVYDRESRGHIFYYIDSMTRGIYNHMIKKGEDAVPFKVIRANVICTMAHERRHEVQPASMLDMTPVDGIGTEQYCALRHESDADDFMLAVINGQADINNPAAWEPERLVA